MIIIMTMIIIHTWIYKLLCFPKDRKYATLSRVRKFRVDGQVIQSTTKKIVDVNSNKTLRDNKKYNEMRSAITHTIHFVRITCIMSAHSKNVGIKI